MAAHPQLNASECNCSVHIGDAINSTICQGGIPLLWDTTRPTPICIYDPTWQSLTLADCQGFANATTSQWWRGGACHPYGWTST